MESRLEAAPTGRSCGPLLRGSAVGLAAIGPEPFGNSFDEPYLIAALTNRKTPMKSALLDQKTVAGLGNIYVCEALFRSKIHPARPAWRVSKDRISRLVPIIRTVLSDAIGSG
ncbi:MAG: hypothetical protein R6U34_01330, partial [Thioalkalivibrio sp.]